MCGESDLKTLVAMLIMDRLDIGGMRFVSK